MKKLENSFDEFSKNRGTEVPMMRKMRLAAELVQHVQLSKNKMKDLTNIVDTFTAVITELKESYFTDPTKDTLLTTIQTEQDQYEDKHTNFIK